MEVIWEWKDDSKYTVYNYDIQVQIMKGYLEYQKDNSQKILELVIFNHKYTINFDTMIQEKLSTNYQRSVRLNFAKLLVFEYESGDDTFNKCMKNLNTELYKGYYNYLIDNSKNQIKLTFNNKEGDKYTYIYDFQNFTQENQSTNKTRKFRFQKYLEYEQLGGNQYFQWLFKGDSNNFVKYDGNTSKTIQGFYQQYIKDITKYIYKLTTNGYEYEINFSKLIQTNTSTNKIRRISCQIENQAPPPQVQQPPLSKVKPNNSLQFQKWSFLDDNNKPVAYDDEQQNLLNQMQLLYLSDQNKSKHLIKTSNYEYEIDLQKSTQTNTQTKKQRKIMYGNSSNMFATFHRSSSSTTSLDTTKYSANFSCLPQKISLDEDSLPKHWSQHTTNFLKLKLQPGDFEYKKVQDNFNTTMNKHKIIEINRIQNKIVFKKHQEEVITMLKDQILNKQKEDPNEKLLWHGTGSTDPQQIYNSSSNEAFNINYCSPHCFWGQGAYFAEKASYSNGYAHKLSNNNKVFLLCSVTLGNCVNLPHTDESEKLKEPPFYDKNDTSKGRYNSVSGYTQGSNVFMLYSMHVRRAYPAYEIIYQ